jgi:hypothetical protein
VICKCSKEARVEARDTSNEDRGFNVQGEPIGERVGMIAEKIKRIDGLAG